MHLLPSLRSTFGSPRTCVVHQTQYHKLDRTMAYRQEAEGVVEGRFQIGNPF